MTRCQSPLLQGTVRSLFLLTSSLLSLAALAQPADIPLDRILFDARPLSDGSNTLLPPPLMLPNLSAATPIADPLQDDATPGNATPLAELLQPRNFNEENVERYLEAIAEEELNRGPFAPELPQQLLALGQSYQQQGEHESALEAFDKAEYISRINNGLHTPEQFAIVSFMIESHLANGDLQQANEKQQYLLFLNQQYYGKASVQLVPALRTLADWNMDAFRSVLNQSNTAGFSIGLDTRSGGTARIPNPRSLAFGNLYLAQQNYYQAILNLVNNQQIHNPLLLELEQDLLETIFLGAYREGILHNPDFYMDRRRTRTGSHISRDSLTGNSISFINGRNVWSRMRIYLEHKRNADPLAIAHTIIGLGDWHMLFNHRQVALNHYREAHSYLQSRRVPEATIAQLLSPAVPQQLPVFTPLPHSRKKFGIAPEAAIHYDGYMDLTFRITRFGNVRDVKVSGKTTNASAEMERRLKRLLHSSPFRPRLFEGTPAVSDTVAVRYYFKALPKNE